jgi:flavorubredoxin
LVPDIIKMAPQATVIGSKVCLKFLADMVHSDFRQQEVKNGDKIDLGGGHELQFVIAPNLHWPDTIFTYDHLTQTAFTCDAFGMHLCSEDIYDIDLTEVGTLHCPA